MTTSQEFREGVVYSRGPLVKGIVRGLIFPALILGGGAIGYIWYRIQSQETGIDLVNNLETTSDLKVQSRAIFDLTKRLQSAALTVEERMQIFKRLEHFIQSTPSLSESTQRMLALVGGLLSEDTELRIIKALSRSPFSSVQAAAISGLSYRLSELPTHWEWFKNRLHQASDDVVIEGLKVIERYLAKESSFPSAWAKDIESLILRSDFRVRWHSLLLLGLHKFENVQDSVLKVFAESFQVKGWKETVLEEYQLKTLTLLDRNWNESVKIFLQNLAPQLTHAKMKSMVEDLLRKVRSVE